MKRSQPAQPTPEHIDPSWRIGIVASSFYKKEIDALTQGARHLLEESGVQSENITEYPVPGSFEVPLIGAALAEAGKVDALIGFGIIVEGETHHAQLLAEQAARGIMDVQLKYQIPFAFEVLYVESIQQAQERSVFKGKEAARAVLYSLAQLRTIQS